MTVRNNDIPLMVGDPTKELYKAERPKKEWMDEDIDNEAFV